MAHSKPISENLTEKLTIFDNFIQNAGLHEKSYQRDGVEWILKNETSPL